MKDNSARDFDPDDAPEPFSPFLKPWVYRPPNTIPPREWLYGQHFIRQFVSATFAPGGLGKSALEIIDAMSMASKKPLIGIQPTGRYRVGYFNGEDPLEETERRVAAAMMHYGLQAPDLDGWLYWGSGRDEKLLIAEQGRNGVTVMEPNVDRVIATIRQAGLDALIIDPFVSCHRVTENDNGAIDVVAKTWANIAQKTNTSIELVHHTRKTNGAETTAEDGRGASSLLFAARAARVLNVMSKEEAERAGVDRPRAYFRVDNGKANLSPPPEKTAWFNFIGVDLENSPTGPGDNIGVVTPWTWPSSLDGLQVADLLKVQQKIASADWRKDERSPAWVGYAVAEALSLNIDAPGVQPRIKGMIKTWIASDALRQVTKPDEHRKPKPFIEVGNWTGA
jgi:hypothetical protein